MALDQETEGSSPADAGELRLTLGQHLEELRGRLIKIAAILVVGMSAAAFLVRGAFEVLVAQIRRGLPPDFQLEFVWISVTDPFMFWFKLSFTLGLAITLPLTIAQLWGFIAPGLRESERKPFRTLIPVSVGLFFMGVALGWFILPPTIGWFAGVAESFPQSRVLQKADDIVYFCAKMLLAFGLGFQLPILVFFATRIGLVRVKTMTRYWRHLAVGVFLTAAVVTPSGDPLSMTVMALPMTVLFALSVWAAKITMKRSGEPEYDDLDDLD